MLTTSSSLLQRAALCLRLVPALLILALSTAASDAQVDRVERTLKVGSLERSYIAYVPDGARTANEVSVVFAFHPGFGSAKAFSDQTGVHKAPGASDFIVVYPEGFRRSWNSGDCCGPAMRRNIDDVAFVQAMLEDLRQFGNISATRNFATGFSNGFAFSQELACRLPDRFLAIAGGGGVKDTSKGCSGAKPISILVMHGLLDEHSPFEGGQSAIDNAGYRVSVQSIESFWQRTDSCGGTRTTSLLDGISCRSSTGCSSGTEVVVCPIPDMGHWWPGHAGRRMGERTLGPSRGDLDGAAAVIRFFRSKL